jgi:hypothetical protein
MCDIRVKWGKSVNVSATKQIGFSFICLLVFDGRVMCADYAPGLDLGKAIELFALRATKACSDVSCSEFESRDPHRWHTGDPPGMLQPRRRANLSWS